MKPRPQKPRIIIAQVEGSGTAATAEIVSVSFSLRTGFVREKLPIVNSGSAGEPVNTDVVDMNCVSPNPGAVIASPLVENQIRLATSETPPNVPEMLENSEREPRDTVGKVFVSRKKSAVLVPVSLNSSKLALAGEAIVATRNAALNAETTRDIFKNLSL
jgi:hypothetical protein